VITCFYTFKTIIDMNPLFTEEQILKIQNAAFSAKNGDPGELFDLAQDSAMINSLRMLQDANDFWNLYAAIALIEQSSIRPLLFTEAEILQIKTLAFFMKNKRPSALFTLVKDPVMIDSLRTLQDANDFWNLYAVIALIEQSSVMLPLFTEEQISKIQNAAFSAKNKRPRELFDLAKDPAMIDSLRRLQGDIDTENDLWNLYAAIALIDARPNLQYISDKNDLSLSAMAVQFVSNRIRAIDPAQSSLKHAWIKDAREYLHGRLDDFLKEHSVEQPRLSPSQTLTI
jgi:hypothetical protein